jgi:IS30 family transposase
LSNNTINNKKEYKHLTLKEREIISMGLMSKRSQSQIAKQIGRHKSTISRELSKYNKNYINKMKYFPSKAHKKAKKRKIFSHKKPRIPNSNIRKYIEQKLILGWSPEQIAGRLSIDYPDLKTNYESIYQYIYVERRNLIEYLPKQRKKRKKRCLNKKNRKTKIPNRVSIDYRPECINNKKEIGHWEADTMISRQCKSAIQVLFERKIKLIKILKLVDKSAKTMRHGIINKFKRIPKNLIKSITYDNGTENVEHEKTNNTLNTKSYFCNPYHSWEKGGVENSIGLIRRYLPKKTDFALINYRYIKKIEDLINNRPRKCLDYKTPNEMLEYCNCCT